MIIFFLIFITGCFKSPSIQTELEEKAIIQENSDNAENKVEENKEDPSKPSVPQGNAQSNEAIGKCIRTLERLGQFSETEGYIDYESGFRIFPLLYFIMTKQSLPASKPGQEVFMQDNPIFVTQNSKDAHILIFAPIHSKRTGALNGTIGFPANPIMRYYKPMVLGDSPDYTAQAPSTDIGPLNKLEEVNRETWVNELKEYTSDCKDSLILPPTSTASPFFDYNGATYPFSEEIDFVGGVKGIGYGLIENGMYYPADNTIKIPLLIYSADAEIGSIRMKQNGKYLKFQEDEYNQYWQEWLGKEWRLLVSEELTFDHELFKRGELEQIHSDLPPFISDESTIIEVMVDDRVVEFINN